MKLASRARTRRIGGGILVVIAIIAVVLVVTSGSSKPSLTAVFANASPLEDGNLVKSNGVVVGKVTSIKLVDGKADVGIGLDSSSYPLHRDATALIEPISLLGERFISLDPGTASSPLMAKPAVIGQSNTGSDVTLDQVLNTLNDPTSAGLASLVTALGSGVKGQGANLDATLRELVPAMTDTNQLVQILHQQNSLLNDTIKTIAPGFNDLDLDQGSQLHLLVNRAEQALATVSQDRQQVAATLDELPGTLANAQTTLAQLGNVANTTTPVLQSVKPVTDNLDQITTELHQFADAANPALAHLPSVLNRVNGLLNQARPVVNELEPTSVTLKQTAQAALPLGNAVLDHAAGQPSTLDNAMTGVADWAMSTSDFDGLGHFFRAEVILSAQVGESEGGITGGPPVSTITQAKTAAKPAAQTTTPVSTANIPSSILNTLTPLVPNLGSALNATGLSTNQQQGLLNQLLGGV